jgi:hypothetical protein
MEEALCPYCNTEVEIDYDDDDGYGFEEGIKHQQQCSNCQNYFVYLTSIHFYYNTEKADCLNAGEHNYKPTRSYPVKYTRMECIYCGKFRQPTKLEMEAILNNTQTTAP